MVCNQNIQKKNCKIRLAIFFDPLTPRDLCKGGGRVRPPDPPRPFVAGIPTPQDLQKVGGGRGGFDPLTPRELCKGGGGVRPPDPLGPLGAHPAASLPVRVRPVRWEAEPPGREAGFCNFFRPGPSFTHHIRGRQALFQYGRRRLPGEREGVQGDWYVDVTTLRLFCP